MEVSDWLFGTPGREIPVRNAEALLAYLPFFLSWPFRRIGPAGTSPQPLCVEESAAGSYRITGPGCDHGELADGLDAAGALADALIAALVEGEAALACRAAAAVASAGGVALIEGGGATGNAVVALTLTARGHRLFASDRLALREDGGAPEALCLGTMAILPEPLPANADPALVAFAEGYREMRRGGQSFLKLWEGEAAAFGEQAPVAVWVALALEPDAGAEVAEVVAPWPGVRGYRVSAPGAPAAARLIAGLLSAP